MTKDDKSLFEEKERKKKELDRDLRRQIEEKEMKKAMEQKRILQYVSPPFFIAFIKIFSL